MKDDLVERQQVGYSKCDRRACDSCQNYVVSTSSIISHATGRRFLIRRESSCDSESVVYVAFCRICGRQGVGSTVGWKKRLANYKSHIRSKKPTCKIVQHFLEVCNGGDPVKNIGFVIVDVLNNTDGLTQEEVDALLLHKEQFWIGTLVTQHAGLNGTHDWNRSKRSDKER